MDIVIGVLGCTQRVHGSDILLEMMLWYCWIKRKEISYSREFVEMHVLTYGGAIEIQAGLLRNGLQRDFNMNATRLYRK